MNSTRSGKLWNRDFFLLWQGHFVSSVGTVIYGIAVSFFVLEETGSTALMGIVGASVYIPRAIVSPYAGAVIDRVRKKRVLVACDTLAAILLISAAIIAIRGELRPATLTVIGLALGTIQAFFRPATQALLPRIVNEDNLTRANAAYSTVSSGSDVIGRFAGGYLFGLLGSAVVILVNGVTFLFSALTELFIREPIDAKRGDPDSQRRSVWNDIFQGFKLLGRIPGLRSITAAVAFLNFCGFMIVTLYVPLFYNRTGLGPPAYGVAMAMSTLGGLLGSVLFASVRIPASRRAAFFIVPGVVSNLLIVAFPYLPTLFMMSTLILVAGFVATPINVVLSTALQLSVPREYHGRVFSIVGMIGGILVPLAMVVGGALAERLPAEILIPANAMVLAIVFGAMALSRRSREFLETAVRE